MEKEDNQYHLKSVGRSSCERRNSLIISFVNKSMLLSEIDLSNGLCCFRKACSSSLSF